MLDDSPVPNFGDPELCEVERQIARKLQELEGQLASDN